ncbi:hypothetical protein WA026_009457 [Henosepilachna vigintioctopunctata]|uniref:Uncharacterized protein n=1 Tax=Henosepilachna vigintioctopunctata TaxID=420089 RepID=A0AAW1U698_9CUCU
MHQKTAGWIFFSLLVSSSIVSTISYPNVIPTQNFQTGFVPSNVPSDVPQLPSQRQERKFAEKPNAIKKVALDDLSNDLETNQISDSNGEGFSWSSLLTFINSTPLTGMLMQLIFPPGAATGPNKSDSLDDNSVAPSPWANLLAAGLKILTAILGGGTGGEGIDKVDNGGSPMQFVNILMTLLNALKTSFSHRSMMARNIGRKDSMSEAAVAGITMMKGYVRSMNSLSNECLQKSICEANRECAMDIGQSSLFCHLGNYAASYMIDRSSSTGFRVLYEAGRRGRTGGNCHQMYHECNEI